MYIEARKLESNTTRAEGQAKENIAYAKYISHGILCITSAISAQADAFCKSCLRAFSQAFPIQTMDPCHLCLMFVPRVSGGVLLDAVGCEEVP